MGIPFSKLHGLGNHFVLTWEPDALGQDWGDLARRICRHHFGVGSDGLLVVSPGEDADVRMRYYDPEGIEDMCGNGLRCVARWSHLRQVAAADMRVATVAGLRRCTVLGDGRVRAEMGEPILETGKLPAIAPGERLVGYPVSVNGREYPITGVSFGTTHAVIIGHDRQTAHWAEDSAAIERHEMFPEQTTVDWVEVVSRDRILMRPWERRLGETLACGTGACSAAVATALQDLTDRRVLVQMKGGALLVEWREDNQVIATGDAVYVYEGTYLEEQ